MKSSLLKLTKITKNLTIIQNGRLPVGLMVWLQEASLYALTCLHMRTKFHRCRWNTMWGLMFYKNCTGAIWYMQSWDAYSFYCLADCDVCANFGEFLNIPNLSKSTSFFMVKMHWHGIVLYRDALIKFYATDHRYQSAISADHCQSPIPIT